MKKNKPSGGKKPMSKIAFFTFVGAAAIYLLQAILSKIGIASRLMQFAQSIVTIVLFILAGIIAWGYVKSKKAVYIVLFLIASAVIVVSVILPIL